MTELSHIKNDQNNGLDANSGQSFQSKEKDIQSAQSAEYFLERVKKVTTAIYIVTNLIPATDPLRISVRENSIRLLSIVGSVSNTSVVSSIGGLSVKEISTEAIDLSKKINAMLEIAFFSGYISEMNFSVLKTEVDIFTNEITDFNSAQKTLDQDSFKVALPAPATLAEMSVMYPRTGTQFSGRSNPTNSKGQYVSKNISGSTNRVVGKLKKTGNSKLSLNSSHQRSPGKGLVETKKTSRKESIISIIKMKGTVSIKDISSVIINCSEKTIQRELNALVAQDVLKKTGDRRWSTYALAA